MRRLPPTAPKADLPLHVFTLAFALFVLLQFVMEHDRVWDFCFYLFTLPCLLWFIFAGHARRLPFWPAPEIKLIATLLVWLCLCLLWQTNLEWFDAFHYLRHTLITASFLMAALCFFAALSPHALNRFGSRLIALASVTALISIALFLTDTSHNWVRLEAIGQLEQPILGAAVYGLVGIIALVHFCRAPRQNLPMLAAYSIITLLIYLTYSRGQLAAFGLCSLWVLVISIPKRWRYRALTALLVGGVALVAIALGSQESAMLLRDSHRATIFAHAAELIAQKPLFGWGAASQMHLPLEGITITHPHNLWLGTLYAGGLVAGALLLAMVVALALRIRRTRDQAQRVFCSSLLIYALLSVLTDNPALVSSPAPFWTFFWLPLCYIITRCRTEKEQAPAC